MYVCMIKILQMRYLMIYFCDGYLVSITMELNDKYETLILRVKLRYIILHLTSILWLVIPWIPLYIPTVDLAYGNKYTLILLKHVYINWFDQ